MFSSSLDRHMIQCNEYGEYEVAKGVPSRLFSAILVCFNLHKNLEMMSILITEQWLVVTSLCGQCRVTIFGHGQWNGLTFLLTKHLLLSEQDSFELRLHKFLSTVKRWSHINVLTCQVSSWYHTYMATAKNSFLESFPTSDLPSIFKDLSSRYFFESAYHFSTPLYGVFFLNISLSIKELPSMYMWWSCFACLMEQKWVPFYKPIQGYL